MKSSIKINAERHFSAHHMLIGVARAALEDAKLKQPGWFYNQLVVITFSSLSVEAICNSIGDRVIPEWKDFESSSPIAKLRLLCDHLKIQYDNGKEPWASARWLYKFRNLIAHAKPEFVQEEKVISRAEYDNRQTEFPKSKLEKEITFGNANRALKTAESIKDILCANVPADNAFGLYSDAWLRGASAHEGQ